MSEKKYAALVTNQAKLCFTAKKSRFKLNISGR